MRISKKKLLRKVLFRGLVVIVLLLLAVGVADFALGVVANRTRPLVDMGYYNNVIGSDKVVALTFDDGPHAEKTPQILEILDRQEVTATFFFMGSSSLDNPHLVRLTHEKGYEIGNHTFTHAREVHSSKERLEYELNITNKIVGNIIGQPTIIYRPPFLLDIGSDPVPDPSGHGNALEWASDAGYIPVGADVDSLDWAARNSQEVIDNVLNGMPYGHIVLLHDGGEGPHTVEALEPLIIELKARGYQFVSVSDIVGLHAAPSMTVTQDLKLGDTDLLTSGNVTRLQTFLLKEGEYAQDTTGVFEEDTLTALSNWQAEQSIADEAGRVGPLTRQKILDNLTMFSPPSIWPTYFHLTSLERKLQNSFILISSMTGKNIPFILKFVLGLVLFRLGIVAFLLVLNYIRPRKKLTSWRGGVSVIVPAYNEEENIGATLDSLLKTKRQRMEIIVVDDGSTDNTVKIIKSIQKQHQDKIRLIQIRNTGKAEALNKGIREARYGVVITMDGDTIFTADTIPNLIKPFGDKNVSGVAGKVCATESKNLINQFQYLEYVIAQNIDKTALNYVNAVGVIPGPVGAWRKSDILALGGYSSQTLVEDQDLTLSILALGKKIVYESSALAFTETPYNVRDFVRQRIRWVFGTIQCLFKHRRKLFNPRAKSMGLIVLPNTLIYTVILPLLYPLMDVIFVTSLAFNFMNQFWMMYVIFMVVDMGYALLAFSKESRHRYLLLLLPFQRLFYRFIIYYVVLVSVVRAIEGGEALWNKVRKRGDASRYHLELLGRKVELNLAPVTTR